MRLAAGPADMTKLKVTMGSQGSTIEPNSIADTKVSFLRLAKHHQEKMRALKSQL